MQFASSETKVENFLHTRGSVWWKFSLVFGDDILACYSEVYTAFADEGGDVGCGKEDQSDGEVLDEGNVEAAVAVKLDVGTVEELEAGGLKATLLGYGEEETVGKAGGSLGLV